MPIEQVYLLKGWLLGQNPPAEITHAVEALVASLKPPVHVKIVEKTATVNFELPALRFPLPPTNHEDQPKEETPPDVVPKAKKRHNWSPEARAKQAERMKERMASGKMGKKREEIGHVTATTPEFAPSELRITVPAPSRKSGLTDADWPEIKKLLASGRSRPAIASDFDEEVQELDFFIASCRRREERGGNFTAPSQGGA